ncbi:MAG: response regulator, partial [Rhodobacterales bacterium]|nr:response regulator [Rhodobacterales bacterium]MDX5498883.1 response regulator [Rhodobacterales bacterium]
QARAALTQTRKRELAAQLTSGLAHDFANLLTIILGLQSRLERMDLPAEAADLVQATLAAARRGGVLLDRIGSISGKRALKPVAVDLVAFGAELRTLARAALPDRVALDIRVDGFGGPVLLDPGALQDALVNLILNARDALGAGGGRITVTARSLRDTWAEFTVSDDGPGFSPEALERGLDPFFTTKGGEGSGLGLAMVYDHVNLAGGSVRLGNRVPRGAIVTLRLPLRRVSAQVAPGLVLLVEDSDDIRESVREMLCSMGHAVIEATSAEEAEALTTLPGLLLILSDINLKGATTGVALAERLAGRGSTVPMALMTSLPASDPRRARAERHFPVLAKPFDAPALAAFLSRLPLTESAA